MLVRKDPYEHLRPKKNYLLNLYGHREFRLDRYEVLTATVGAVWAGLFFWSVGSAIFTFFFALAVLLIGRK